VLLFGFYVTFTMPGTHETHGFSFLCGAGIPSFPGHLIGAGDPMGLWLLGVVDPRKLCPGLGC